MEIKGSTEYVDLSKQKEPWYQLNVTNMWDWTTKSICNKNFENGHIVHFHLNYNSPISDNQYKSETVTEITQEIKDELAKMGYNVY